MSAAEAMALVAGLLYHDAVPPMLRVPEIRVRPCNEAPINERGEFVLYWMIAARRARYNFGLQRAIERAIQHNKPLVVLEALRSDYRWASDRLHRFIIDGMADNDAYFATTPALYYPYVEATKDAGKGLLRALAERALLVVTDDYPAFFLPRMVESAANKSPVLLEAVDGNGLLPLFATTREFSVAHSFRRFLQKTLPDHLADSPLPDPLSTMKLPRELRALPREITKRWPRASDALLSGEPGALADLPIDHGVHESWLRGGAKAAEATLSSFLRHKLARYAEGHNHPDEHATSELSPYLHFGHLSVHEVFARVMRKAHWSRAKIAKKPSGRREGWWGASPSVEAFLDQLVTWRELGFNMCHTRPDDYDRYESLPDWARETLDKHKRDPRKIVYSLKELEEAKTHDPIWNAAQRQLVREGRIHNYLRMLWGKNVLAWSKSPEEALATLIELNNKYALDGRDPNSYSGIFWVFGRYDRAWGPEREIFGTVRYMSSDNTRKKLKLRAYLECFGPGWMIDDPVRGARKPRGSVFMPTTNSTKEQEIGPRTSPETQRRAISERGSRGHLETEGSRETVWPGEGLPPKGEEEKPEEEEKADQEAKS